MAKKKRAKMSKSMDMKGGDMMMHGHHKCCWNVWAKLSAMAFILFLITVWPWAMDTVHSIHWGWFLGATVVFCIIHCAMHCKHWKCCKM